MVSTQASQLRLTQRSTDTGWIDAAVVLQRANATRADVWVDALAVIYSSRLQINGGTASYYGLFERRGNWRAVPHRLFLGMTARASTQQRAGTMSHIKPDGTTYDYPLVITPDGYLTPLYPEQQKWQFVGAGDKYQFTGSWSIA